MIKRCSARILLLFFSLGLAAQSGPPKRFRRFEASLEGFVENVFAVDLNQDGLKDLIVTTNENGRRPLQIFFQTAAGFADKPDDILRLDDQVIFFDFCDIVPSPGIEIVGLTRSALLCYVLEGGRYKPEPVKWMDVASVLQSPSPDCPVRARLFYDGEDGGCRFLFFPDSDQSSLVFLQGQDHAGEQRIAVRPIYATGTSFRSSREDGETFGVSQKIGIRVPRLYLQDFNGDKRKDLLSVYKDRLQVFYNRDNVRFSQEPDFAIDLEVLTDEEKNRTIPPVFQVEAVDLDDDGFSDVVVSKSTIKTTAGITKIYIHLNRNAQIKKTPDEILMLDNSVGFPEIIDLDGDGHKDLVVIEVKFSLIQILKMLITKKISFKEGLYIGKSGKFPAAPNLKLKGQMEFDFDNSQSLKGEYMRFEGDFNGDGVKDLMQVLSNVRRLKVFAGNPQGQVGFAKEPLLDIREEVFSSEFVVEDLNNDKVSDVIFDFQREKKKILIIYLSQ